jgi:hypothetical protein
LTGLTLYGSALGAGALTTAMARHGLLTCRISDEYLLELHFDGAHQNKRADFRPHLPLVFRW